MPFCSKCGAEINQEAKFCKSCGSAIVVNQEPTSKIPTETQIQSNKFCRNCGKALIGSPEICLQCGAKPLSGNAYCYSCGSKTNPAAEICLKCGAKLSNTSSSKQMSIVLLLGFLVGILLWGIGHIYIGKTNRGVAFLVAGIIIAILFWVTGAFTVGLGSILFFIIGLAGWIIQGWDAYNTAKKMGMK